MKLSLVPWMAFKAQDELTYEWRQYQKLLDGEHVDHRCHSTHTQQRHLNVPAENDKGWKMNAVQTKKLYIASTKGWWW